MNRLITVALLAFGLAVFTPGQDVSKTLQGKGGQQVFLRATASPESLDFGDQGVHTTSKPSIVTLTNNTDKPIKIRRVKMSEGGQQFVVVHGYEFVDITLEAGKSCSIEVVFFPLLVGERTALLLIIYDDPDHPQKISLKGNGINPSR